MLKRLPVLCMSVYQMEHIMTEEVKPKKQLTLDVIDNSDFDADNETDWERSLERKKPGRKKGPRRVQIHPYLTPETVDEINQISQQKEISQGLIIELLFKHWSTTKPPIFDLIT